MPKTEISDEQLAADAYERWLDKVHAGDGTVATGEPSVFLAGWMAGRDFQTGYEAGLTAVKATQARD